MSTVIPMKAAAISCVVAPLAVPDGRMIGVLAVVPDCCWGCIAAVEQAPTPRHATRGANFIDE
jgi:hypothetical protein